MVRAGVSEEVTSVQKGTMVGRTWGKTPRRSGFGTFEKQSTRLYWVPREL